MVVRQAFLTCLPDDRSRWFQKPIGIPTALYNKFDDAQHLEAGAWYWKVMRQSFPNARYFTVLRHPCDVVLSSKSYWGWSEESLWQSVARMAALIAHPDSPIDYAVNYTALVTDGAATIQRLFSYLNVPFCDGVMEALNHVHAPSEGRTDLTRAVRSRREQWNELDSNCLQSDSMDAIASVYRKFGQNLEWPDHLAERKSRCAPSTSEALPTQEEQASAVSKLSETIRQLDKKILRLHVEYSNQLREKDREHNIIWSDQKKWIAKLEEDKAWLKVQLQNYEAKAQSDGVAWSDLQKWVAKLEEDKALLKGHWQHSETEALRLFSRVAALTSEVNKLNSELHDTHSSGAQSADRECCLPNAGGDPVPDFAAGRGTTETRLESCAVRLRSPEAPIARTDLDGRKILSGSESPVAPEVMGIVEKSAVSRCSLPLVKEPQMSYVIFACCKSGTTWLQRLISAHPQAVCCESRAFGDYLGRNASGAPHITIEKFVQVLSQYYAPAQPGVTPQDTPFYQSLVSDWMNVLAAYALAGTGKRVYGEKCTPYRGTAQAVIRAFHRHNPNLKFIHLVRDGRDVIVSGAVQWLNQRCHTGSEAERAAAERALSERQLRADDFEMFLDLWTDAVGAGLAARAEFPANLQITYEAFLADSTGCAGRLFEFLGLDADPAAVAACVAAASFQSLSGGRMPGEEDCRSFFRKGAAGDWRNWFHPHHLESFERRAGHLMAELGYALD